MKSRYSQILTVLCALLAFAPVFGVDQLLDGYIRKQETARAQRMVEIVTREAQAAVYDGIQSLKTVIDESPSLCTPTFVSNVKTQMQKNTTLRQMLVENTDGVQYCDAYGQNVAYVPISQTLSVPGKTETISVVKIGASDIPLLKIKRLVGSKFFSAFVSVGPHVEGGSILELRPLTAIKLSLTNGEPLATLGDYDAFENRKDDSEFIGISSFAGEVPIRAQAAASFALVRADYAELDVVFTIFACVVSAGLLLLALQFARHSGGPSLDLAGAIQAGEIKPYYQPFIDLTTGRLLGCEVLVRWEKPNGEMVPPGAFIDYAEHSGLAIPMTVNLMQQVRKELSSLCSEMPDLKISINLFEGHFRDNTIIEDIETIFGGSDIRFEQLVFEITERRPLTNHLQAYSVIAALHALGSRLAMDDVGTGHSNLAVIQTLGVDIIKIDRVFVDMVKEDTEQVPVLDGLIKMAKDLGAEIVAEGVETEAQALYLRSHGVTHAQGFLFAPALKPKSFIALARTLNSQTVDGKLTPKSNIGEMPQMTTNAA